MFSFFPDEYIPQKTAPQIKMVFVCFQIYHKEEPFYYIDTSDTSKSNWMRYVSPANGLRHQNLVACQVKFDIYFYTIKPVPAGTELYVWYCHEFAERIRHSLPSADRFLSPGRYLLISG